MVGVLVSHIPVRFFRTMRPLGICIFPAFCLTLAASYLLQTRQAEENARHMLSSNLDDGEKYLRMVITNAAYIREISDAGALTKARAFAAIITQNPNILNVPTILHFLRKLLDVEELNVADDRGVIIASTGPFAGYDMASSPQSAAFLPALRDLDFALVQDIEERGADHVPFQYAGVARRDCTGIVQIGYSPKRLTAALRSAAVDQIAPRYHIGSNGFMAISIYGAVISTGNEAAVPLGSNVDALGLVQPDGKGLVSILGKQYICQSLEVEGYTLFALLPRNEVFFSRDSMLLYIAACNLALFAVIFWMVSHLVKRLVINDVYRVNEDLQKITSGNLDVVLNERTTPEFGLLSDGINKTVQSLKAAISAAAGRIDAELEFARAIQCSSLPSVFPAYPEREDFDIFAVMRAAKVVGGDFYDFYLRDKNQLVIVVADVADKGIGAALFMMTAKTLIKSLAESGLSPAEIFTQANKRITAHNDQDIFLTAFLAVLDLTTGRMICANAGHEHPLIFRRAEGRHAWLEAGHGLPLGAMPNSRYREQTFQIAPGDRLLLYTDGVSEAENSRGERFGLSGIENAVLGTERMDAEQTVQALLRRVDDFASGVEQADDITILALEFTGLAWDELLITADDAHLETLLAFLEEKLKVAQCPAATLPMLLVTAEEVFANIAHYAYAPDQGTVLVRCRMRSGPFQAVMQFQDTGRPFNPLHQPDPDTSLPAEQRREGGLGIAMMRKIMSRMEYARTADGKNILTLWKQEDA